MQAFGPFLDGYCNAHIQLYEHLKRKTLDALADHSAEKAAMHSADCVEERAKAIRQTFLDSLGGLPDSDAALNPRVVGCLQRGGYRIEKVIFESQPRVFVTSLLYVPDGIESPTPGVLFLCGHGREGKGYPEYQRVLHDLALSGFVALAIDPPGQGERVTHMNPDTGEMKVGWGTTEHSYQGMQCILTGTSIARYFLFDAMRGVDYLQSRPEVDPERIGVTGNSGGGTQTALLCMSGDERIKAAVPCTYVTSREHYFQTGQAQDAEQLQFAMTRNGINFDDMFIPFAPRPLLIGAVDSDFFSPEGTSLTYGRLRDVYRLLGCEDLVECTFAPGVHMYCRELRRAAVNWFRQHLMDCAPDFVSADDGDIDVLPNEALWCTSRGHVPSDYPDTRTVFHLNRELLHERASHPDGESLRNALIDVLGIREKIECHAELYPRQVKNQYHEGGQARSLFFRSEPGIMVAGALIHRVGAHPEEVTIHLAPEGTNDLELHMRHAQEDIDAGGGLLVFDVRGTGAVKPLPINPAKDEFPASFYSTEGRLSFDAYCLGESMLGMRVFDVLRAAQYLRTVSGVKRIALRARGLQPCLWGYLAAALDSSIQDVRIEGLIESFEAIARTPLYRTDITPSIMLHGVLQRFDIADLRALYNGRTLDVVTESVEWRS